MQIFGFDTTVVIRIGEREKNGYSENRQFTSLTDRTRNLERFISHVPNCT